MEVVIVACNENYPLIIMHFAPKCYEKFFVEKTMNIIELDV